MQLLSERLIVAREATRKSQKELAESLGISFRSWQDYELGKSVPGGKVFEGLVHLGFNANWLLAGEGSMRRDEGAPPGAGPLSTADQEMLGTIIEAVEQALDETDRMMKPRAKASLVMAIYDLYMDSGKTIDHERILRLVKSAA